MKARLCALFVCMFAIAVIAQSVDGKWSGEVQGGRGPQPGDADAQGRRRQADRHGGRRSRRGEPDSGRHDLRDRAEVQDAAAGPRWWNPVTLNWSGTLKGDEIAMSRKAEGGEGQAQEFVLKREK